METEKVWCIVKSLYFQVSSNNWSLKIENKNIIWCHSESQQLIGIFHTADSVHFV